jgi:hypothetical protein
LERNTFQMNRSTGLQFRDFRCPKVEFILSAARA